MVAVHESATETPVASRPWQSIAVRRLARMFLTALAIAILLPLLESVLNFVPAVPLDEHRNRTAAPEFSLLLGSTAGKFADQLNAWFDERIGFRDAAIRWAHDLDARLFGVSRKVY